MLPKTELFGELEIIKAALVYDGLPVLFVVRCERGYELLAIEVTRTDDGKRRWYLAPQTRDGIYDVMTGKMSVREAFEEPTSGHIVYLLTHGSTAVDSVDAKHLPERLRPGFPVNLAIPDSEAKKLLGIHDPYAIDDPDLTLVKPAKTGRKKTNPVTRDAILAVVSPRVRELREARGWSQAELAEKSDVTLGTIVRLETAKSQFLPGLDTLVHLARAFRVSLHTLLPE